MNLAMTRGQTPLICAAANSNATVLEYLVQHGADVNQCMGDGTHPLHAAVLAGSVEMTRCLVSVPSINLNPKRIDRPVDSVEVGYTPLQYVKESL